MFARRFCGQEIIDIAESVGKSAGKCIPHGQYTCFGDTMDAEQKDLCRRTGSNSKMVCSRPTNRNYTIECVTPKNVGYFLIKLRFFAGKLFNYLCLTQFQR